MTICARLLLTGAVLIGRSNVWFGGETVFDNNTAEENGGTTDLSVHSTMFLMKFVILGASASDYLYIEGNFLGVFRSRAAKPMRGKLG